MLSTGAFNALLKTLEEPPAYVIFILATTEVHKIPVTVLSRCQRYDFRRIDGGTITARLAEMAAAEESTPRKKLFAMWQKRVTALCVMPSVCLTSAWLFIMTRS